MLLGYLYQKSSGQPLAIKDDEKAVHFYRLAAEHGYDSSAQHFLGDMYLQGFCVPEKDNIEALRWYRL